jgi:hypothetical protein
MKEDIKDERERATLLKVCMYVCMHVFSFPGLGGETTRMSSMMVHYFNDV